MEAILEFFSKQFYGNTVGEWLLSLGIILGTVIVAKLILWITKNIVRKLTDKTKTKIDNILVDMLEEPLAFALIIIGVWFALEMLNLPASVEKFISQIYYILIIFDVAWLINRLFSAIVKEYLQPLTEKTETDLDDQLLPIIVKGIKITVWIVAIIIGLNNAGYNVGALLAGMGIGGLALAMAAKDSVSNIFGGFTIFTDKPFTIKDRVVVDGVDGTVEEIGIRSTRLRTLSGRIVTMPNSKFTDNKIENISSEPNRKIVLNLGLTYNTDHNGMQKALDLLKEINEKNESTEENIVTGFNAFNDFALNILFIYYIKKGEDIMATQTAMNMEILKQFNENKLEFAFPTQTIFTVNQ